MALSSRPSALVLYWLAPLVVIVLRQYCRPFDYLWSLLCSECSPRACGQVLVVIVLGSVINLCFFISSCHNFTLKHTHTPGHTNTPEQGRWRAAIAKYLGIFPRTHILKFHGLSSPLCSPLEASVYPSYPLFGWLFENFPIDKLFYGKYTNFLARTPSSYSFKDMRVRVCECVWFSWLLLCGLVFDFHFVGFWLQIQISVSCA